MFPVYILTADGKSHLVAKRTSADKQMQHIARINAALGAFPSNMVKAVGSVPASPNSSPDVE